MGTHSDDESQSRKKLKSSENTGMRFNPRESCIEFSLGRCTYGEKCRYVHDIGSVNQRMCEFAVSGRACWYGDKCPFLHESGGNTGIVPNPYDYDCDAKSENLSRPTSAIRIKPNRYYDFAKSEEKLVSNEPILPNPNDDRGKSKILPNDPHNAATVKTRTHGNEEVRRVELESSTGYDESQRGKFPAKLGNLKKNSQVYGDWIQDLD